MKKKIIISILLGTMLLGATGCEYVEDGTSSDVSSTISVGSKLAENQPTPTDIDYSLERYNLIKRAYWVNGMRDKARSLASPIADMPLGYIVLLTDNGGVVGKFVVDGKVSSLNSYLTPDSELYECVTSYSCDNEWLPDVDGSYGSNDNGIFFFTTDGKYVEWTGTYLYSDIPFEIDDSIVKVGK